ncbi:hypothetical protein [Bacteroides sp. 519]|uniref:hypothetical protein n=1 Tax=Bacteroides sp. 519 TaxID=2302937 RepID=UPI0013D86754|nr:hypothetical protein [Bacteroides sp. 519]NDV58115.1 hypothetical protein [Bacteroides sp. 519]
MKKSLLLLAFLGLAMSSVAQSKPFGEGKWFINPSITGLDLSYSKDTKMKLGVDLEAGAFLIDNFALLVGVGAEARDNYHRYSAGVGGRYYFNNGLYVGAGFDVNKEKSLDTYFNVNAQVGYAFFLTRNITLEPAVYCKLNTDDGDLSKFGLKIGFGLYF